MTIKNFDNLTVTPEYSDNYYYDDFQVDTDSNVVYFVKRDANHNGWVIRYIRISVREPSNDVLVESLSADRGYEQIVEKQCPKLVLRLLEETKAEIRNRG